jgi:hypothetical protein
VPAEGTPLDAEKVRTDTGIRVDQFTQRTDADARYGHMVVLPEGDIDGEHVGDIGVYDLTYTTGADGYPDEVGVTLRELGQRVRCRYADIRETDRRGR